MNKKTVKKSALSYLFLFILIIGVMYLINVLNTKVNQLSYSEFIQKMEAGELVEVNITPSSSAGVYSLSGTLEGYKENESFYVEAPLTDTTIRELYEGRTVYNFDITTEKDPSSSFLLYLVVQFLPIVLLVIFAFYFLSKQMGSANKSMDFGKSRARLNDDRKKVSDALNKASGFIKTSLAKKVQIRKMPDLHFVYDESLEYGKKIEDIIERINNEE